MRRMATLLLLLVEDHRQAFLMSGCPRCENLVDLLAPAGRSFDRRQASGQALACEGAHR